MCVVCVVCRACCVQLYLYKSYASNHGEDTSLVWATFLRRLVESHLVPAVIVPAGHPDARTFSLLSSSIPTHYTPSLITYRYPMCRCACVCVCVWCVLCVCVVCVSCVSCDF